MKPSLYALCALIFLGSNVLRGQQQPSDPMGEYLFPPELLMQHQQAIGLTEEQRNFVKTETQKAQSRFTDLQWQLQNEMEGMVSLVKQERIDEQKVLAQLEKILNIEREIKRTHLALVVHIKNKLTPEQQVQLKEIKNRPREK